MSRLLGFPSCLRSCALAAILLVALVPGVAAHEGQARLILEPNLVNPGGVVTIRGEDLGADHEMRVALVGDAARADLATVTSDGQGHFIITVQIAGDAPAGAYSIEAAGSSGLAVSSDLVVEGAPISDEDPGAPPDQDEGLPALPAGSGGQAVAGVVATIRPTPLTATTATASGADIDIVPFVALAGAIGALAVLAWRTRRPPAPPTSSADLS